MLAPPANNSDCPICKGIGQNGKLKVTHTKWGWEVTCTVCQYYDSWQSPNYGREPWEPEVIGAHF